MDSATQLLAIQTAYKALQIITGDLTRLAISAENFNDDTLNAEFNALLNQVGKTLVAIDNAHFAEQKKQS